MGARFIVTKKWYGLQTHRIRVDCLIEAVVGGAFTAAHFQRYPI
jgi:hypothetical protein